MRTACLSLLVLASVAYNVALSDRLRDGVRDMATFAIAEENRFGWIMAATGAADVLGVFYFISYVVDLKAPMDGVEASCIPLWLCHVALIIAAIATRNAVVVVWLDVVGLALLGILIYDAWTGRPSIVTKEVV